MILSRSVMNALANGEAKDAGDHFKHRKQSRTLYQVSQSSHLCYVKQGTSLLMSIKTGKVTTVIFEIVLVWYGHTHPFLRCVSITPMHSQLVLKSLIVVCLLMERLCTRVNLRSKYLCLEVEMARLFGDEGCCSDGGESSCSDGDEQDDDFDSSLVTHGVIFKCIGVTKDSQSQESLAVAAQKLRKQEQVEVCLRKNQAIRWIPAL